MKRIVGLATLLMACSEVLGASTGRLPASVCGAPLALFADGLEGSTAIVRDPSNGSGGPYPGAFSRSIMVNGTPRTYYLRIPPNYMPSKPLPLLIALHGTAGDPLSADAYASALRTEWATIGNVENFIVATPVATGASGSWLPSNDHLIFSAIVSDMAARYNIDRTRLHAWGFSAGGHFLHGLMLDATYSQYNADDFAGYAVAAGALAPFMCNGLSSGQCNAALAASRKIPLSMQIGTSDPVVPPSAVQGDHARFLAQGWADDDTLRFVQFSGEHEYSTAQLRDTWQYLCPFQRLP